MFPYKDENPTVLVPVVTVVLIAFNVACWVFIQGFGMEPALSRSVCQLGLIPAGFLYLFGDNVEDAMGHLRFGVFYLLTGVAAAAAQVIASPRSALPMVGASG